MAERLIAGNLYEQITTVSVQNTVDATTALTLPATIAAHGSYQSPLIPTSGFPRATMAVTSDQAGSLTLQFFMDQTGHIPVFTATTAISIGLIDVAPAGIFQSVRVTLTNSSASIANLSNSALVFSDLTGAGSYLGGFISAGGSVRVSAVTDSLNSVRASGVASLSAVPA